MSKFTENGYRRCKITQFKTAKIHSFLRLVVYSFIIDRVVHLSGNDARCFIEKGGDKNKEGEFNVSL